MALFKKKQKGIQPVEAVNLFSVNNPTGIVTEQVKTIRTNISFTQESQSLKTIMLTSTLTGEGKSTVAANLAVEFAQTGKKTVILDTDLRRSTVDKTFRLRSTEKGLTSYLIHRYDNLTDITHETEVDNLFAIPSGPTPPNPAELIASEGMKKVLEELKSEYDIVIVDAPPLLAVTDSRILANMVDGVVFVVRQNVAAKQGVKEAKEALDNAKANVLGFILNDVESDGNNGYYGEGYYGGGYYADDKQ